LEIIKYPSLIFLRSRSKAVRKFEEFEQNNKNDQHLLAKLAKKTLCLPATSTESERMSSKAGEIISKRRTALKSKVVDQLLFINKNWWITN